MQVLNCPRCKGSMEEGFIIDLAGSGVAQSTWSEGPPESSFWQGKKVKSARKISTYRCEGCGYLESYASGEPHKS